MSPRVKKFLSYYKPYLGTFLTVMACALLVAASSLLMPLGVRYITKDILENGLPNALRQVYQVGGLLVLLIILQTVANIYVDYRGHSLGAMMESDLRAELFAHFQKLPFRFYDENKTGQLMSRLTNDLFQLAEFYHHAPEDLILYLIKFFGAFAILATINLRLTLIIFLFLPVLVIYSVYFSRRMHAALKTVRERIGDINAQVEDTLSGIRVVKSFANEPAEQAKFARENQRFLQSRKTGYRNETYWYQGVDTMVQLVTVALVVFGSAAILNVRLDLADLLTFLLYLGNFTDPIQKLQGVMQLYQEGFTGFERFMEIIEIDPEIADAPNAIELDRARGQVEFRRVSFKYKEDPIYVLKDVSLQVSAGEYVALVGTSGVGKTTLCSLIPRFYEVSAGEILLDGVNIQDIRLESLRRNIGVVQQDVYLFAGTVFENIRYGKPDASREEVIAAARKANAHGFISQLPRGYDADIGQRGVKLSGGQKQRLSIARVFLKDPPVLIFDEATSSLDNESERVVQDALELLAANRTTFVIAHRLSTIRGARRIIVLSDQGIDEQGSHAELLARGGTYARLYRMQFMNPSQEGF